ncbi:MAG TPA: hypothetical protein VGA80_02210 [Flavobacteriaceae bacterium]
MDKNGMTIDTILSTFKNQLNKDFDKYRNHVHRVYLNCTLLDENIDNHEKYAIASVFHDIGIWTAQTFDYLNPSIKEASVYLISTGKTYWQEEIAEMIQWHHKINPYEGKSPLIEMFRKADIIDISFGLFSFGVDKSELRKNKIRYPVMNFHQFLFKKALKNLFKNPFNPLPMFKI